MPVLRVEDGHTGMEIRPARLAADVEHPSSNVLFPRPQGA
ncbi:hypothetical protein STRTUCAR8_03573 [Streptomyces turgidiscabies Car8]|uniref:Uncharacterized protein n=1 Tax=Streptomyces turgidiscabies (strain Car8) TaxID=698760 RepID=L7FAE7_STRT8|nr:hypothetical protein STRTUCAR8_03573 [Streptomyces turgidiscabies Car8]